jgi:putative ubiquitin-RnfH superfamily antitoxin RatB of RatAB toxin-antitoxin module
MLLGAAQISYTVNAMSTENTIKVEVAYALPHKQVLLEVDVPAGCTVVEAAMLSGVTDKFEGIDLDNAKFGIFGQVVASKQVLREGDRVEIYRPLVADPKDVRKARAERAKERRQHKSE